MRNSRCRASEWDSAPASRLTDAATSATSRGPSSGMATSRDPRASAVAASAVRRSGRDSRHATSRARPTATRPVTTRLTVSCRSAWPPSATASPRRWARTIPPAGVGRASTRTLPSSRGSWSDSESPAASRWTCSAVSDRAASASPTRVGPLAPRSRTTAIWTLIDCSALRARAWATSGVTPTWAVASAWSARATSAALAVCSLARCRRLTLITMPAMDVSTATDTASRAIRVASVGRSRRLTGAAGPPRGPVAGPRTRHRGPCG